MKTRAHLLNLTGLSLAALAVFSALQPARNTRRAPANSSNGSEAECEQFRGYLPADPAGQQVVEIGVSAIHPEGGNFHVLDNRLEALKDAVDADSRIPESCKRYLVQHSHAPVATIVAQGELGGGGSEWNATSDFANQLLGAYQSMDAQYENANNSCSGVPAAQQAACLEQNGPGTYAKFGQTFSNTSAATIKAQTATQGAHDPLAAISDRGVALMQVFHNTLNAGSQAATIAYLGKVADSLTIQERLTVVQMFGSRWDHPEYNEARNKALWNGQGVVTMGQLLGATQNNYSVGYFDPNTASAASASDAELGGVCRDIASAQGEMLEALKFRNVYVVSYAQLSGEYHVTVIAEPPANQAGQPQQYGTLQVYKLNYGTQEQARGGDIRSLLQPADASIDYRISKPGGAVVADVQSAMGKFLTTAAGFDIREIDPLARAQGYLIGGSFAMGASRAQTVNIGVGQDGNGAQYAFVGATKSWGLASLFPGKVGLVLATQQRPGDLYASGSQTMNLDMIYLQLEQQAMTPNFRLSDSVRMRIEAAATLIFMAGRSRDAGTPGDFNVAQGAMTYQGDLHIHADVKVEQGDWSSRFRATYMAGVNLAPGIANIQNNYWAQVPIPVLNSLFFTADGRLRLSQSPEGRAFLIAATTILIDEMGIRARLETGITNDHFGATILVEGRVTDDTAIYKDGSERRAGLSAWWTPNQVIRIGLNASTTLEQGAPNTTIMGTGQVTF